MPNVINLLEHDHRKVEQLFQEFESTSDFETAKTICQELTVHSEVEKQIVYPVLKKVDADLEQHAEEEHQQVESLVARVEKMSEGDQKLKATMKELKDAVMHHVQEEEQKAFPEMREQAGGQLDELGTRVEKRKQELQGGGRVVDLAKEERAKGGRSQDDLTKDELYEKAKEAGIPGRSNMSKDELARALRK